MPVCEAGHNEQVSRQSNNVLIRRATKVTSPSAGPRSSQKIVVAMLPACIEVEANNSSLPEALKMSRQCQGRLGSVRMSQSYLNRSIMLIRPRTYTPRPSRFSGRHTWLQFTLPRTTKVHALHWLKCTPPSASLCGSCPPPY
jgi:hypothetical protein